MGFVGLNEALLLGAAVLALVLGPKKLPELARSLGESKKEFRKSMKEADEAVEEVKPDAESEVENLKED
ncbi:MAG: twin-arginine translocase TatA/TatE family subunit [Candidatus Nanohalobium sp.]